MHARHLVSGLVVSALALTATGLSAGPAAAAYTADPDDVTTAPSATPRAADLVGAGSDTTQRVMALLARAYNATPGSCTQKLYTYAASAGGSSAPGEVQLASKTSRARPRRAPPARCYSRPPTSPSWPSHARAAP